MKKANGIRILSALLMAMTTLCGCAGGTNDSSPSSSATMSSEKSSSNDTSDSSSATTSSEESSSTDDSSSSDPYLEALNITYTLDEENHTYTVTGVKDKQAEEIDLPRELTIDNVIYVLVRIEDFAFSSCSSLTSITIPDSVTSIGECAFEGCNSLESLTLPFIDTYLGYYFGATTYEDNSTYVPESLKTIIILGGTSIPADAFYECSSLTSIVIPNSVTSIGGSAFNNCTQLQHVTFEPNSKLESISGGAFYRCTSLISIIIPNSVTSIGYNAFFSCYSLTIYCEVSEKPSKWDSAAWYNNPVYWGINENNFVEKDDIQYVIIDEEAVVTRYVGTSTNVVIPTTIEINGNTYDVTSIGDNAFYRCSALSITIPDSVTSIGNYAFYGCSTASITIPNSVTTVGGRVFESCNSLTIYCEVSEKPSGWDDYWNLSNRPVYWGNEWHYENGVPTLN